MTPPYDAAERYANRNGLTVCGSLGSGVHGWVFLMHPVPPSVGTALKVFWCEEFFSRELEVYGRLMALGVRQIRGFAVPQYLRSDRALLAIEMTVVGRPFVLDFAGAFLVERAPVLDAEEWNAWESEYRDAFGARWPEVKAVLAELRVHGVEMLDCNPRNVGFAEPGAPGQDGIPGRDLRPAPERR